MRESQVEQLPLIVLVPHNLAAICVIQQRGILTSVDSDELCSILLNLETSNDVRSVA